LFCLTDVAALRSLLHTLKHTDAQGKSDVAGEGNACVGQGVEGKLKDSSFKEENAALVQRVKDLEVQLSALTNNGVAASAERAAETKETAAAAEDQDARMQELEAKLSAAASAAAEDLQSYDSKISGLRADLEKLNEQLRVCETQKLAAVAKAEALAEKAQEELDGAVKSKEEAERNLANARGEVQEKDCRLQTLMKELVTCQSHLKDTRDAETQLRADLAQMQQQTDALKRTSKEQELLRSPSGGADAAVGQEADVGAIKALLSKSERERRDLQSKLDAADSLASIVNGRLKMTEERLSALKDRCDGAEGDLKAARTHSQKSVV